MRKSTHNGHSPTCIDAAPKAFKVQGIYI